MQVFGHFFQVHSSISGSGESSLSDSNEGSTIEHLRSAEKLGNPTQDNANEPSHAILQAGAGANDISHPVVNLAHKSSSRNAKGFWNAFLFRGKSDRYVLPIRNVEVRQEKCRALTYSQVRTVRLVAYLKLIVKTNKVLHSICFLHLWEFFYMRVLWGSNPWPTHTHTNWKTFLVVCCSMTPRATQI